MNVPERRDIQISLSLPREAQEAVQKRASTWHRLTDGVTSPKEHQVRVLTIRGAVKEDIAKIQQAVSDVKKRLEGFNFKAEAYAVRYTRGGADLKVGSSQEEDPIYHIKQTFLEALQQAGVRGVEIESDPHIPLVQPREEKKAPPSLLSGYDMAKKIGWNAIPSEHLVMKEKLHETPKNSSSPDLRSRQAGQSPQPRPGKPL